MGIAGFMISGRVRTYLLSTGRVDIQVSDHKEREQDRVQIGDHGEDTADGVEDTGVDAMIIVGVCGVKGLPVRHGRRACEAKSEDEAHGVTKGKCDGSENGRSPQLGDALGETAEEQQDRDLGAARRDQEHDLAQPGDERQPLDLVEADIPNVSIYAIPLGREDGQGGEDGRAEEAGDEEGLGMVSTIQSD